MRIYEFTSEQVVEIETAYKTATNPQLIRHLEILYLRSKGASYKEIQKKTGLSFSAIWNIICQYSQNGLKKIIGNPYYKSTEIYEFTSEQIAEIEAACQETTNQKTASRLAMLCFCAKGKSVKAIARDAGVSQQTVRRIVWQYKENGLGAVIGRRSISQRRRNARYFTPEQIAEIETAYQTAADDIGKRFACRLRILHLRASGARVQEIVETTGIRQPTVNKVILEYKKNGLDAVKEKSVDRRRLRTEFTPEQISELQDALGTVGSERVKRRIRALLALSEGQTVAEAAETSALFLESVRRNYKEYQRNGLGSLLLTRKTKHKRPFMAYKYNFTDQQKAEIKTARKTVAGEWEARKLEALWLRAEKKNIPEISAMTGIKARTLTQLIRIYQEKGLQAAIRNQRKARQKD